MKLPHSDDQPGPGRPVGEHQSNRTYSLHSLPRAFRQPGKSRHTTGSAVVVDVVTVAVKAVCDTVVADDVVVVAVDLEVVVMVVNVDAVGASEGMVVG